MATSVLKDCAKTLLSMPVVNKVLGIETVLAFALPRAEIARAGTCGSALYWKCTSPLGNTKISPVCSVLSKELVGCINKPNLKGTLNKEKELKSARMSVGWVRGASRELEDSKGNTLPTESQKLCHACFKDLEGSGRGCLD